MKKSWVRGVWQWFLWQFLGLLGTCKERNHQGFGGQSYALPRFKPYLLKMLYSWSVGLHGDKNLKFLDLEDCIMDPDS